MHVYIIRFREWTNITSGNPRLVECFQVIGWHDNKETLLATASDLAMAEQLKQRFEAI